MKRIVGKVLLGMAAWLFVPVSVFAAGINSEEQRVISAVSQPFSYDGKIYVVSNGSIAEGKAKLAEEGVDLTKSDADSCIAQFRQSYAELVSEGYCQEYADEDTETDTEIVEVPKVEHSGSEAELNKTFLKEVLGNPVEEEPLKGEADEKKEPDAPTPTPYVWSVEESVVDEIEFTKEDVNRVIKKEVVLSQNKKDYILYSGHKDSYIKMYTAKVVKLWKIILLAVGVITALVILGMCLYLLRARRKGKKRFRRKKYFRGVLAVLAGVCIAVWSGLLLLSCALHFGAYGKSLIHQKLMESNYFSGITQMLQEQAASYLEESGYDGMLAEEIFGLSNVYIEEKQYIDEVLSGKEDAAISTERIHKILQETLNKQKKDNDALLIEQLEAEYQNILEFELGKGIMDSKKYFVKYFIITLILAIFSLGCLSILLYKMYHRVYKVVTVGACGLFTASFLTLLLGGGMKLSGIAEKIVLSPAFYQEFVQQYISGSSLSFVYISGLGLLLAGSLFVWRYHLKKYYDI